MSTELCEHGVPIDLDCGGCEEELARMDSIQRAEMRAETFAAEAVMGMPAGTTEGWYDDPQEYDFIPGYPTEMDYMNAMEADDYIHEGDDLDE